MPRAPSNPPVAFSACVFNCSWMVWYGTNLHKTMPTPRGEHTDTLATYLHTHSRETALKS